MKFRFLDSFLVFTILSFHSGLIILTSFLWTTFLIPVLLTNFTPKEGNQEQPDMGLLAVSQLEQVYSTIYIY